MKIELDVFYILNIYTGKLERQHHRNVEWLKPKSITKMSKEEINNMMVEYSRGLYDNQHN